MARVTKDGIAYTVNDDVRLSAFLAASWVVEESAPAAVEAEDAEAPAEEKPKPKRRAKKQ